MRHYENLEVVSSSGHWPNSNKVAR